MKHKLLAFIIAIASITQIMAQERTVENRPYTDLRPFHFGVLVGTHFQDLEFQNAGFVTYTNEDGQEQKSCVTTDQDRWDAGFTVGVLGEFRLNSSFQFRIAPAMYFGTHHLTFHNMQEKDGVGNPIEQKQELKTAYISAAMDLIFAAQRFNNHRPYIMAGLNPMLNLNRNKDNYIKLKKNEIFLELGFGCDFYMPFFKLRPELKFMLGLTDCFDQKHISNIKDKQTLPYAMAVNSAHSKIIALTFYFE